MKNENKTYVNSKPRFSYNFKTQIILICLRERLGFNTIFYVNRPL